MLMSLMQVISGRVSEQCRSPVERLQRTESWRCMRLFSEFFCPVIQQSCVRFVSGIIGSNYTDYYHFHFSVITRRIVIARRWWPNRLELRCVRPSVCKKFFRFRYNLVCASTSTEYDHQYDFDPIQGQGHWASEVAKIALFYVYLLHHFGMELKTGS